MPPTTAVTSKNAMFTFYDIESLDDAFTLATYTPRTNTVELFFLVDEGSSLDSEIKALAPHVLTQMIGDAVIAANPAFKNTAETKRSIVVHNLSTLTGVEALATAVGLFEGDHVNNPRSTDAHGGRFRPVCDTAPEYDPINKHAYWSGYNSYAYDTTILAVYLHEAMRHMHTGLKFKPVSPKIMRQHNDRLFSEEFRQFMPGYLTQGEVSIVKGKRLGWDAPASIIRKAMLDSGRHIDVSRLNEGQRAVGLKRLLGGMGRQILESDKLGGHNSTLKSLAELIALLAYNVSDVVGLAKLFEHPAYSSTFDLKKGLLDEYPETVYDAKRGTSVPDIQPWRVRMGRLAPDATSAKFVARILAPYKPLDDIETVSFLYPSDQVAAETGVARRNILDDCVKFFEDSVSKDTPSGQKAHHDFQQIVAYYRTIEGQNFNDNKGEVLQALGQVPRTPNNLPYFAKDGTPSSCFVTFSTGGIHGAEYDEAQYENACTESREFNARMAEIREKFPEPLEYWLAHPGKTVFTASDGTEMTRSQVLTAATSLKALRAEQEEAQGSLQESVADASAEETQTLIEAHQQKYAAIGYRPDKPMPELFEKTANGATKLKPAFNHTSAARVTHEDFTSYYPNMLRNMSAFYNPELGADRYAKIFEDKEQYGRQMKQPGISSEEKTRLGVLRNGTKLILNSASGAGDTAHPNPIRMNNQIISMRIIGQLFSWRIGQAQTMVGARIISTNTDGLYSVLEDELNNRVLAEQAALINVDIEPEPLWLISKDSNNRLEIELPKDGEPLHDAKIISASGGTLACHSGPQPTKSLAHPAVVDWALARYLREIVGDRTVDGKRLSLSEPMNRTIAMWLMTQARDQDDTLLAARLFQNVLAASAGKLTFPFATAPDGTLKALQHFNRVFVMKAGTENTFSIQAAGAWVVNQASRVKRKNSNEQAVTMVDPVATPILEANGWTRDGSNNTQYIPADQDVAVRRVPRLDPEWAMRIDNRDLAELDAGVIRSEILSHLDLDAYVEMLASTFEENWQNEPV